MREMKRSVAHRRLETAATALMIVAIVGFGVQTSAQQTPEQAGEHLGVADTFVRVATNDEGWVVVGYEIANESVGKEWMLLEVGLTLMHGNPDQKITRGDIKLVTPSHEVISLPSPVEFSKARGSLAAMTERANIMRTPINYFPAGADHPCRIGFFNDPTKPMQAVAYDEVELSSNLACVGRMYFPVPGGIQVGNYNLDVRFANSIVKVPIEIMTKERVKEFEKEWKEAQKEARRKEHEN